jgi:hypothetical protein
MKTDTIKNDQLIDIEFYNGSIAAKVLKK